jgi:hypothetical protein
MLDESIHLPIWGSGVEHVVSTRPGQHDELLVRRHVMGVRTNSTNTVANHHRRRGQGNVPARGAAFVVLILKDFIALHHHVAGRLDLHIPSTGHRGVAAG